MSRRGREVEMLLLAMLAAVPLYFTRAVGLVPVALFHLMMGAIVIRVAMGRGPEVVPQFVMRGLAFLYIFFYIVDAVIISRSAIAASTHLVLFIAAYQPIESLQRNNLAQRLLTTGLIFVASLATSTHLSIVAFVIAFGFLMFRQMLYVSHIDTVRSIGRSYALAPTSRAAGFYIAGTLVIGALLFPLLPRLRNPMVQGMLGTLRGATTGLSESIDFSEPRASSPDPAVVARVWMGPESVPFFTPLRLRGAVYDSYSGTSWLQTSARLRTVRSHRQIYRIARPLGFGRAARVQQTIDRSGRLFFPAGTYAVTGLPQLYRGATRDSWYTPSRAGSMTYEASMSRSVEPLEQETVRVPPYPASPQVRELGRRIAGGVVTPTGRADAVEQYLLRNYQYVLRPEDIGRTVMSLDDFLLRTRRGHCEYFAAGMVALLSTLDVPARIVGGFYGGRTNPLTGYLVVRREDAHAWVEVWDGARWVTYDPTPPALRPGSGQAGLLGSYLAALGDSASYFWDRYILTYGLGDQVALAVEIILRARNALEVARTWFEGVLARLASPLGIQLAVILAGLLLLAWTVTLRRRTAFDLLARYLRGMGIEVSEASTMEEALAQLRMESPEAAARLEPLIRLYEEERFSARRDPERRRLLRKQLAELRA
jgi:transglutaminase-like putative cysteine protease